MPEVTLFIGVTPVLSIIFSNVVSRKLWSSIGVAPFPAATAGPFRSMHLICHFYITLGNHDLPGKNAQAEWEYAAKDATQGGSPRWTANSQFTFTHYRVDLPSSDNPLVTLIELDSTGSAR